MTLFSSNCKFESSKIPFPKKLFSFIPPPIDPPEVPTPAPKEISPVGFSSTLISIVFKLLSEPSFISYLTEAKTLLI